MELLLTKLQKVKETLGIDFQDIQKELDKIIEMKSVSSRHINKKKYFTDVVPEETLVKFIKLGDELIDEQQKIWDVILTLKHASIRTLLQRNEMQTQITKLLSSLKDNDKMILLKQLLAVENAPQE